MTTHLTKNEIVRLPSGEEMNGLIAERVMNWSPPRVKSKLWVTNKCETALLPNFSQNPAYLQEMHDRLHLRGWGFQWVPGLGTGYGADFFRNGRLIVAYGDDPNLAFCRAALLVSEEEATKIPPNH